MKTEPTAILEVIRLVAILAGSLGIVITAEEQTVMAGGIGALVALVSVGLAIKNRLSVFSPKTTKVLVDRAAATGIAYVGDPPKGT